MRLLLRVLLLISVSLLLSIVGVIGYVMQDQRALLDRAEAYFKEAYQLDLKVRAASVSSWRQLPNLQVALHEVSLRHPQDTFSHFQLTTVAVDLHVMDYWWPALRLDTVVLSGGQAYVQAGSPVISTIRDWVEQAEKRRSPVQGARFALAPKLNFVAQQLDLLYRDTRRAKHMEGSINLLQADIAKEGSAITSQLDADLRIERLTFNPAKGSYLENTRVRMQPQLTYEANCLVLPTFDLWLEEECFTAAVELETSGGGYFDLDLKNENTSFAATVAHVPGSLRQKMAYYHVAQRLATRIRVAGGFAEGENPVARIDFETANNQFGLKDYPQLENVAARGYVMNRVSLDSSVWESEHPLNLSLHLTEISASYEGIRLQIPRLEVSSTPYASIHLEGDLRAEGQLRSLPDFWAASGWKLVGGRFRLRTEIAGPMISELDLLRNLNATVIDLRGVRLRPPRGLGEELTLSQAKLQLSGDSLKVLDALISLPGSTEMIALDGFWIKDWPWSRDQGVPSMPTESFLSCRSSLLSQPTLAATLELFGSGNGQRSAIHPAVQNIQARFNPRVEWQIDSLQLSQGLVRNIILKASLDEQAALRLERLRGRIETSTIDCSGTVDFAAVKPEWNMVVFADGAASWFNRLFNNNTFFFEQGRYQFAGSVKGPVENWADLLRFTKGKLALWDGEVLLGPTAVRLPLEELRVDYGGDHLRVEDLRVPLSSGQNIQLAGEVRHFRNLLVPGADAAGVSSSVQVKASRLDFQDLDAIFSSVQQLSEGRPTNLQQAFKPSLQEIYRKFHPCLELRIDTFQLQQFISTDNLAQVGFLDENRMVFDNTGFEFKGRPVQLSAIVDIREATETPFEVQVETERFDLAALVETYDYFGLTTLQRAERVAGKVSLRADLQGRFIDSVGLQKDRMLGRVQFNLHEAELVNFAPIQEVANKFFRTERLQTIRFAPITDTLYITHRVVHIPRMEIQSTAFNLFVEGHLNYDDNTNIWVSLPWQNLKSWQEGELPAKTGYAESGGKLFVEIRDEGGEMKYRLRLTNKRLYEHRGIPDQYRIDKKKERAIRRAWRKKRRQARRTGA